ncbi:hypothetical protein GNI_096640 [Gregarina niphandrodes]|uniref:Uncharacterized protein n=1 Tax=Gregarina niphandrodes TaxID=110365 RepID=A0A023B4Z7_GRENI|nr:hypothetical protein GNI_096640 [Gregarina niphandrodes]EZG57859.1 hypothetical protein GNI_096640 [Gregarina niphandrodes]|eukprot:XP_011131025.1 hypothetical protein GNI_096640 [Gregarina niphandrodes]
MKEVSTPPLVSKAVSVNLGSLKPVVGTLLKNATTQLSQIAELNNLIEEHANVPLSSLSVSDTTPYLGGQASDEAMMHAALSAASPHFRPTSPMKLFHQPEQVKLQSPLTEPTLTRDSASTALDLSDPTALPPEDVSFNRRFPPSRLPPNSFPPSRLPSPYKTSRTSPSVRADENTMPVEKRAFPLTQQVKLLQQKNARLAPELRDRRMCPDCGRRGSGSRSQNGVTYFYCRNSACLGKGSSKDRFIGWAFEENTRRVPAALR